MNKIQEEYHALLLGKESLRNLKKAIQLFLTASKRNAVGIKRADSQEERLAASVTLILSDWMPQIAKDESLPAGDWAFLVDLANLILHQSYFALLPSLDSETRQPERSRLLNAYREFAGILPRAADRFSVLALYHDASGDPSAAAENYREAVLATHSNSHEFLSVLQAAWSSLIERGRHRDALKLLLEVEPRIVRSDFEEFREMILLTFDLQEQAVA